jgi:hypothetical protein
MVLVGVERVHSISPGLIKAFDLIIVILLTDGDHKFLVLDDSTVLEGHFIVICVDALNPEVVRAGVVFAEGLSGGRARIEFNYPEFNE